MFYKIFYYVVALVQTLVSGVIPMIVYLNITDDYDYYYEEDAAQALNTSQAYAAANLHDDIDNNSTVITLNNESWVVHDAPTVAE